MKVRAKIKAKTNVEFDVYELFRRDGEYSLGLVKPEELEVELNQVLGIDLGDYGTSLHYDDGLDRFHVAWPGKLSQVTRRKIDGRDIIRVWDADAGMLYATFKYESKEKIREILPEKVVQALDALNEHEFDVEVDGR